MVEYLGEEELEGTLGKPVEGIGEGSTSGATRMGIVSQLEGLKLKVMVKSLEQVEDREARPVWSWPNRDKMTTCWLLALPGVHTSPLPPLPGWGRGLGAGGWTSLGTP